MSKEAIVLAAGRGERMMTLTEETPKPLLSICGKPMMQYVTDLLVSHGVQRIGINLNYKGDQVVDYFGDGSKFGVKIFYLNEGSLSGTAGGVRKVAEAMDIESPFFVISADMIINFDLTEMYDYHVNHGGIATLACYWRSKEQLQAKKSGLMVFNEKTKLITRFVERPQTKEDVVSQWVNSSVYIFDRRILDYIQINEGVVDLPKDIFPLLLKSGEGLYAYLVDSDKYYQLGIDTPERIRIAECDIISGKFKQLT